jgi:hypothetical protein
MVERDFEPFCTMLQDVWAFYPQAKSPSAGQMAMFFRALGDHSIAQVRKGFDAHVKDSQRGRFAPLPADIVAQIEGLACKDRRPGPEEAWSIALAAADERKTLVWTDEIAQAWGIAKTVYDSGDEVGARMAFREAYTRILAMARQHGAPARWTASIGTDPEQRDVALQGAYASGLLLDPPEPVRLLAAPDHALSATNRGMPPEIREKLAALRDRLANRSHDDSSESTTQLRTFVPVQSAQLPPGMRGAP